MLLGMPGALPLLLTSLAAGPNVPVDNEQVRVVIAANEPGQKSRPHKHEVNRVMIHLDPGKMRLTYEDGKVNDVEFKAGDVRWDPADGIHTSENAGSTTYHIVEVELKKPGTGQPVAWPALDPVKVDPGHHNVEIENDQVRVLRFRLPARDKTPIHEHMLGRVTVYLTDQFVRVTLANGRGSTFHNPAGKVSTGERAKHAERNLTDRAGEVIFVELKTK